MWGGVTFIVAFLDNGFTATPSFPFPPVALSGFSLLVRGTIIGPYRHFLISSEIVAYLVVSYCRSHDF